MLKKYLKENNLKPTEFAKKAGISQGTIYKVLNKKSLFTSVQTCIKIYNVTGLSPWDYLDGLEKLEKLANRAGN